MKPVPSTAKMLFQFARQYDFGDAVVNWAVEMMLAGYESENLYMLAADHPPYNYFQIRPLLLKVLDEFDIAIDEENYVLDYQAYQVRQLLAGNGEWAEILRELYEIDQAEEDWGSTFIRLYWAFTDLEYDTVNHYWEGATRENIGQVVHDALAAWLKDYEARKQGGNNFD